MKHIDRQTPQLRDDGLQLDESRTFQERFWTAERVAWVAFGLLLLLAVLGLTGGGGPFASASARSAAGEAEYPRVARATRPETLTVRFASEGERHRLVLLEPFAERFEIEAIAPEPARSFVEPRGLVYEFETAGAAPAPVRLTIQPSRPGWTRWRLVLDEAEPISASTFIMP